jgi:hypothetical protein
MAEDTRTSYSDEKSRTKRALMERIGELAPDTTPAGLLQLAEAFAWVEFPAQPHGSSASAGSK